MAKLQTSLFCFSKTTLFFCIFISSPIAAQITPDSSLPQNSRVVTEGNTSVITDGSKSGSNLFHSFTEFSIPTGNTAYFNNSLDVQNIISRITGSSISEIDGLIRSNGTANLFLLNPNGIVFNTNARLEIGGSFLASTANSLEFADSSYFRTDTPQSRPILTSSVPVGLGFGSNPGQIVVRGDGRGSRFTSELIDTDAGLQIQPNKTLALIGGNLFFEGGTIKTAGGRVELGSVIAGGIKLDFDDNGFSLDYKNADNLGDILLSKQTVIDASGLGGGSIRVRGKQVSLLDSSELSSATLGSGTGKPIDIEALDLLKVSGLSSESITPSFIGTQVFEEQTTGSGGDITIKTAKLLIENGGGIQAITFGEGKAGNLTINASEVEVTGTASNNQIEFGSGIVTSVFEGAKGSAGSLFINTDRLSVRDGAQIQASTFGIGSAGNLTINAKEIEVVGTFASRSGNEYRSALLASSESQTTGTGGNLLINTDRLSVRDGAYISASTLSEGAAGNLVINAQNQIELLGTSAKNQFGSALAATTTSSGNAGSISITTDVLTVSDEGEVTVSSEGLGKAGNLNVLADSIKLNTSGKLIAETTSGQGGDINIEAQNLTLQGNSLVSTTAGTIGAGGDGGNITIDTGTLTVLENSDITANAFEGKGGNIQITTQGLFRALDSDISASSKLGVDGSVNIQTLGFDVRNSLTPLDNNFLTSEEVVAGSCLARRNTAESSFIITGSGGLPVNPHTNTQEWENLSARVSLTQLTNQPSKRSSLNSVNENIIPAKKWKLGDPIIEAQGIVKLPDGRVLLGLKSQEPDTAESLICKT